MADGDFVQLNATWLHYSEFKCKDTEAMLQTRKDAELAIRTVRIKKGCGKLFDNIRIELDDFGYKSCLCHENFQHPMFNQLLSIHERYEKGNLPYCGGLLEQPAQIIEILNLITKLKLDLEIKRQKEIEKANKGKRK